MKKNLILFSAIVLLATGCSLINEDEPEVVERNPVAIKLDANQVETVESNNTFAFNVFDKVLSNENAPNVIISPLSISYALSMTLNGANGQTLTDMQSALQLAGLSVDEINGSFDKLTDALLNVDKRVNISIANSIWIKEDFTVKQEFIDKLEKYYDAETKQFTISIESLQAINKWIEEETNGMIKEMLKELNGNLVTLLINAIYFEGEWTSGFDAKNTVKESFTTTGGSTVQVDMMKQTGNFNLYKGEYFAMLELPYGQGNYVMDIILPDGNDELDTLLTSLTHDNFNTWTTQAMAQETTVWLPRFKYSFKLNMNDILCDMGMSKAFSYAEADFSNMTNVPVYIGFVQHNAAIETEEKGTKAAAATVVGIFREASPGPTKPYFFNADHSFIYIIREVTTNTVIFMGKVSNPS